MAFTSLFMAHAPDADRTKHRSIIRTGAYTLHTIIVKDQQEAIEVCKELLDAEHLDSVLLCPGFTHADVAGIVAATEGRLSVSAARGDGPSNKIAMEALKKAGY
jgi:hypothetical protein